MLFIYTILFFASIVFYYTKLNAIASGLMIALVIFLYYCEYKKNKRVINFSGFFALGFIGGFGLSLLKLSKLSTGYNVITIIIIYVSYFSLYLGRYFFDNYKNKILEGSDDGIKNEKREYNSNFIKADTSKGDKFIIGLIIITFAVFLFEASILKFIPLFTKDTPHAYSTFHIFMVHYITTFYIFIPSFAVANHMSQIGTKKALIGSFIYVIIMSLLLVSRSQLIQSFVIAIFVYLIYHKGRMNYDKKMLITFGVSFLMFLVLYLVITYNRAHDIAYLEDIFEMKNPDIPIFITQPYMYIAHNFENLNFLVNNLEHFTFGSRILAPLFTLTLIKKFFPIVLNSPTLIIKEELTTKTIVYDAYYDFGIVGVVALMFIIGFVGSYLEDKVYSKLHDSIGNNYTVVLYALYCYYMLFSFFQTYFSLTDTWVYIIFIILIIIYKSLKSDVIVKNTKT